MTQRKRPDERPFLKRGISTTDVDRFSTRFHYETEGMARLRQLLSLRGFSDHEIDTFKNCLITLEREGLKLMGDQ